MSEWHLVPLIGLSRCVAEHGTLSLSSGFSWLFHALMCVGWRPVVCLGLVSSFRKISKFVSLDKQPPNMIKFSS